MGMNEDKVLMLWPDKRDYWPVQIKKRNTVEIEDAFYNHGIIYGAVRKMMAINGIGLNVLLGSWKKDIGQYDAIIVQASRITAYIPDFLRKKGYQGRIIYWYWDPVSGSILPEKINRKYCELWSFDYMDCQKYNMKFNDTYYVFDEPAVPGNKTKWDVMFVGRDKGRLARLNEIKDQLDRNGLRTLFHIVPTKPYSFYIKKLASRISYEEILEIVKESGCILDINQKNQSGLSQRCMESLYFNKKILTDNVNVDKYKFFDEKMVLPLQEFSLYHIKDIITDSRNKYSEEQREYYSFENWLSRFGLKMKRKTGK